MTDHITAMSLLYLLQHGDSQFPSGSFAFSAGLEGLFEDGRVDEADLSRLAYSWLGDRWRPFEQVFVCAAAEAHADVSILSDMESGLEAMLLSRREREGSLLGGRAFLTAHERIGTPGAAEIAVAVRGGSIRGHRSILEGSLWRSAGLSLNEVRLLSAYSFLNSMLSAAVRLGICGAIARQKVMAETLQVIPQIIGDPVPNQAAATSYYPMAEIALMRMAWMDRTLFST